MGIELCGWRCGPAGLFPELCGLLLLLEVKEHVLVGCTSKSREPMHLDSGVWKLGGLGTIPPDGLDPPPPQDPLGPLKRVLEQVGAGG